MSSALERLGRFAARCPWIIIGSWVPIGFLARARRAPGRAELFDGWYPRINAPIKGRTVLDTSGRRPIFEQPDDFLDYLTDVVVPSTAQLPRS